MQLDRSSHPLVLNQAPTLAILSLLFATCFFRIASFPGLHGDEAWSGLRALEIAQSGVSSVHGMTWYSGALFPSLVAAAFSLFGPSIFTLRLVGALLNWVALVIAAAAFWNRGRSSFYLTLLF